MNRHDIYELIETIFYVTLCIFATLIFILPLYLFRLVQDRTSPVRMFFMKHNGKVLLILCILIITGIFLRLYNLAFQCAWTDENYTLSMTARSFADIIAFTMANDCNPPLFYLVAKVSTMIFGQTIVAVRLVSAICGILAIPAVYLIGKEYSDDVTGLLAAGFITVLYPFVYYSQFARSYMMMVLLFSLALLFFLKLQKNFTRTGTVLFVLFSLLAVYAHLFTIMPLTMLTLWLIIKYKNKMYVPATVMISGILPLLYLFYLVTFVRTNAGSTFAGLDWFALLYFTPMEFFGYAYPLVGLLLIYAIIKSERSILLFFVAIATVIALIAASFVVPVFSRYILMVVPVFLIVALEPVSASLNDMYTDKITNVSNQWKILSLTGGIIFVFFLIQYVSLLQYFTVQMAYCFQVIL